MLSYCLKCEEITQSNDPVIANTINGKIMMLSGCDICGSNKSKLIKKQEASDMLSNLGLKTPLSKIPLLGHIFFKKL